MILNLSRFNQHVEYQHFKMDSIDLNDAYYSVPIAKPHQKYLKFVSYRADPAAFCYQCFSHVMAASPILCFSTLKSDNKSSPEDSRRESQGARACAEMANPSVVAQVNADVNPVTNTKSKGRRHSVSTQQPTGTPPTPQETVSDSMSLVRRCLDGKGLLTTATKVMEQSWRSGTRKQYATYLQKWKRYSSSGGVDPICPSVEDGINFLAELYDSGTSPRMPRHIRELFVCAVAKIQNRLEKSANNNKEYGQKATTCVYVFLFHGHINFSGQRVSYGNCRERIDK